MSEQSVEWDRLVIVGASHAGVACAEQMRANGFDGQISLIDLLPGKPLERPPLSKAYLQAENDDETGFLLRRNEWYQTQNVTLYDGVAVTRIDPVRCQLMMGDGRSLDYDRLVLATGATPRHLDAARDMKGVFVLRDPRHARAIRAAMKGSKTVAIVGGGYIGLEAAASCAKAGMEVHVIEMADRLLARVASPEISAFFARLHEAHDVTIHLGRAVADILSNNGVFHALKLSDNTIIEADMMIVGIGVLPEIKMAADAGLETDNGILVDDMMRTSHAKIYAIGDVARRRTASLRIESVDHAQTSATIAAASLCGVPAPMSAAPWFWSEQFNVRLQSAGIVPPESPSVRYIKRLGKREGGFSIWSYEAERLVAVESVRDPAAYMLGKACLDKEISPSPEEIANPTFDLKARVASGGR